MLKHSESVCFFSHWKTIFDWFLWLWLERLETQLSQVTTLDKSPFKFEDNITKNEHFALFSKKDIGDSKRTLGD